MLVLETSITPDKNKPLSDSTLAMFETVARAFDTTVDKKADKSNPIFTGTVGGITKTMVSLGNVDNTSDKLKPVSDSTLAMFSTVAGAFDTAVGKKADKLNPTFSGTVSGITKTMVGLENVDNTSDTSKPISSLTQTALNEKANSSTTYTKGEVDTELGK